MKQAKSVKKMLIADLKYDPQNARKHSDVDISAIAKSLDKFNQQTPIVITPDGTVVKGNGTMMAAQKLGWTHIDTVVTYLTGDELTAYKIADNQTGLLSEWDLGRLSEQLIELEEDPALFDALSFGESWLAENLPEHFAIEQPEPEIVEDEVPEPPVNPITKPGDLWILGEHRLLCGDSTNPSDVARLLNGTKPFLMITDPPYGVEYDANWRNDALRSDGTPSDGRATGKVLNDERFDWTDAYKLSPAHVAYVWHAGMFSADIVVNLRDAGFKIRSQVIWKKSNFAIGRGHYHWHHEPCWYAVRDGGSSKWCGDRTQSTIWEIAKPSKSETGHSTQKPVECMARPIRNHGGNADDVHDPFSGSGTTIIACEKLQRRCFAMELNPAYVDVAVQRWEALTGKKAIRQAAE